MAKHTVFDPNRDDPFILSRTAIDEFLDCPKCFYLKRRLGLAFPKSFPLTLAIATDAILKNEFDEIRRNRHQKHHVWKENKLNVCTFSHQDLGNWRNNFRGIRYLHVPTNQLVFGAVDDIWQNLETNKIHIVDYKSTSKKADPDIESGWGFGYKRQMEIYQWLFHQNGFDVSEVGYFLYINGRKDTGFYETDQNGETVGRMLFKTNLIPYSGNFDWVDGILCQCKATLEGSTLPKASDHCDRCRYFSQRGQIE